jgi:DNA-binding transcriptional regulator YiaG
VTNKQIRKLRKDLRMTQGQMAERMGVSVRTVQGWEAGKQPCTSAVTLLKLLKTEV